MEIPLIKSWIHINVMEGITRALVDPGKIDIPFSKAGPVSALQVFPHVKQELAQGVLTIQIKGTPSEDSGEDIHYTRLRLGKCKRQTLELPATQAWEDCCSFFVFNLLNVKHKCKRLLTTVTLEQHDLELSSFPFTITKQLSHEIKNKDGSKLNLVMDYSPLPPINLDEEEAVNVLQRSGVLFVCVHCANNVIASDKTGSSDPYCVVFCDRRRRYRLTSTDSANNNEFLYVEDMVSPGTMSNSTQGGGKKLSKQQSSQSNDEFMRDKVFVDLTLVQAKELIAADTNGYSDPFCEIWMRDTKLFSSSVKKKTLSPMWNESVALQQVFDKDLITRNDFLGKVMLTLDDLKELSLKGTDDWFPLKHTKSGQIQLRCSVTAAGNKPGKSMPSVSKQEQDANNSAKSQTDGTKPSTGRGMSIESDVFITPSENQKLKSTPDITRESDSQLRKRNSSSMINNKGDKASPVTSTPLKKDQNMEVGLKRSASDVNMDKRRRSTSNSLNSFAAFNDLNIPNRRRLRLIFGNRVIAKSPLIKATQTIVNLPIDIDRGMGIHGDTLLKFDIKREGKEHLASRAYTIKTLFSGEGGEGDKVQKVLPLENNLQIEVYLQHTPVDSSSIRRHGSSRMSVGSRLHCLSFILNSGIGVKVITGLI
ncbi:TCB3-like protein [Mya arenaria]|uniref:TCB3-like protein n=1 Tax=Mya arenaria TaxID=6604 RepID=A0ABY7FBA5_MYAAR|nr:TCB3-like protein [Mya arenaria]